MTEGLGGRFVMHFIWLLIHLPFLATALESQTSLDVGCEPERVR